MSIKTFVSEFQDYLFVKRSYLQQLTESDLSASNIELAFRQTEDMLEEFKTNVEFLEKNGRSINEELLEMFNSLEKKVDKINRFCSALIGINSTIDSSDKILTLSPYTFDNTLPNWEHVQKCYMLPPKSSYVTVKPYSNNTSLDSKKGLAKFLIDDTFSTKYLKISKDYATNINNIVFLNSVRDVIAEESLLSNLGQTEVILNIPSSTRLINIEYEYAVNANLELVPLSFYHESESFIALEDVTYKYGDNLLFNIKSDLPFGCYAQIKLDLIFKDINDKTVHTETSWYPIDNDGRILTKKKFITTEKITRVWSEGLFVDVNDESLIDEDSYVLCEPEYTEQFAPITESSFKMKVKHASSVMISPTLQLYSLLNQTSTPRIYTITGLTKND